jgi:hypothetical protein
VNSDVIQSRGAAVGPRLVQGFSAGMTVRRTWRGHEICVGLRHRRVVAQQVPALQVQEAEEREGPEHRWIARHRPSFLGRADTAVSIEREVVSGHAYAIPAPETVVDGRCGYDNR